MILSEVWSVIAKTTLGLLNKIDNNVLSKIVNLLTIFVILLGLTDWFVRKFKKRKEGKEKEERHKSSVNLIAETQKSFRAVSMLDNPMEAGEKIGDIVDNISKEIRSGTMKKFFKWLWYNKEQLFSIVYNIIILVLSQIATWTDLIGQWLPNITGTWLVVTKAVICVISIGFTALTVRNVCVKYGLSSLETIDKVLSEKAVEASKKLSSEQKKEIKTFISTLQKELVKAKTELKKYETMLVELTTLYNADASLVTGYTNKKAECEAKISNYTVLIGNIEKKLELYKAQLDGKNLDEQ